MWKLAKEYRAARLIHLIVDNCTIHSSKRTKRFLAPFDNRIERVWLDVAFMRASDQKKQLNPSLNPAIAVSGSRSVVQGKDPIGRPTMPKLALALSLSTAPSTSSASRRAWPSPTWRR